MNRLRMVVPFLVLTLLTAGTAHGGDLLHEDRPRFVSSDRSTMDGAAGCATRCGTADDQAMPTIPALDAWQRVRSGAMEAADLASIQRAMLTADEGVGGSGFRTASEEDPMRYFLVPTDDLDGDGKQDVFTVESAYSHLLTDPEVLVPGAVLRARRGVDATELWHVPVDAQYGSVYVSTADLTADGTPEVILLTSRWPVQALAGAVIQEVRVLDGSDGSTLWERRSVGTFAFGLVASTWQNIVAGVRPMPDANGDGHGDILLETWNMTYTGEMVGQGSGHVLDGRDGSTVSTVDVLTTGAWAIMAPAPDLSGDGLADILTFSSTGPVGRLTAHRGQGGEPLWETEVRSGLALIQTVEMTGDDRLDVLLDVYHYPVGVAFVTVVPFAETITAVDGASGTTLWDRTFDDMWWGFATVVGDVDGDGIPDVRQHSLGPFDRTTALVTLSGATGAEIWSREYNPTSAWLWPEDTADLSGDGVLDVLLERATFGSRRFQGVSGKDGSIMWTLEVGDKHLFLLDGDMDANGTSDLALFSMSEDCRHDCILSVDLLEGSTTQPLWGVQKPGMSSDVWAYPLALDITGDDADEVLLFIHDWTPSRHTVEAHGPAIRYWTIG